MDEICTSFVSGSLLIKHKNSLSPDNHTPLGIFFLPLGNLFFESFKVIDFIAEVFVVFLFSWSYFGSVCLSQSWCCWKLFKAWLWYPRKNWMRLRWLLSTTLNCYLTGIEVVMIDVNFSQFCNRLTVVWHNINPSLSVFWILKKWQTDCRRVWCTIIVSPAIKHITPSRHYA